MIHQGDCFEVLKSLAGNSLDALVTDPPAGISFMGKDWDGARGGREHWIAWMRDVMRECLRVMKPGAHGLVWAIPRTSHWTGTALEQAGFEVRDVVTHLFGSGFPKSLSIGKAIDKASGAERSVIGKRLSGGMGSGRIDSNLKPSAIAGGAINQFKSGQSEIEITAPATLEAKQWEGWGTALKPSVEKWILVRKPLVSVEFDRVLCYSNTQIGEVLCRLSPAKFAEQISGLSLSASKEAPLDSVQWLAAALNILGLQEKSDAMDMFSSLETGKTFLSIALSWRDILIELSERASKYTTKTVSDLTIELRILNSLLSKITRENITPAQTNLNGPSFNAVTVKNHFDVFEASLEAILTLSVHGDVSDKAISSENLIKKHPEVAFATRLAPFASEIFLIRKPISEKTVAANVLKWGTGGINIDAGRIGFKSEKDLKSATFGTQPRITSKGVGGEGGTHQGYRQGINATNVEANPQGRFPANLVLSCDCPTNQHDLEVCAVGMLDEQSGVLGKSSGGNSKNVGNKVYGKYSEDLDRKPCGFGDTGGASRFFYVAKASAKDKNAGLENEAQITDDGRNIPIDNPYLRGKTLRQNHHPTVKSTRLMEYLINLITPPNGTILDPFMGSGSTGVAAKRLGFHFIGIEKEETYYEIAKKRLEHCDKNKKTGN